MAKDLHKVINTRHGFMWGDIEVTRLLIHPAHGDKQHAFLRIKTPKEELDIRVTPSGLIRLDQEVKKVPKKKVKEFSARFDSLKKRYETVVFRLDRDTSETRSKVIQELITLMLEEGCPDEIVDRAVDILQESYGFLSNQQRMDSAVCIEHSLERREETQLLSEFRAKHEDIFLTRSSLEEKY